MLKRINFVNKHATSANAVRKDFGLTAAGNILTLEWKGLDIASRPATPRQSQTLRMRGNSLHGNRETPEASVPPEAPKADGDAERSEKAPGHTSDMHAFGESDGSIVPKKRANKAGCSTAEPVEGRGPTQGNDLQAEHVPDSEPDLRGSGLWDVRAAVLDGWSSSTRGKSCMR